MRVLYVESAYGFGGSLTGILDLITNMPAESTPHLILPFDPTPFMDMPASVTYEIVKIPPLPKKKGGAIRGLWQFFRTNVHPWFKAIRSSVKHFKPDLIHANNSFLLNVAAGLAGKAARIPSILHQKGFEYESRLVRAILSNRVFSHHIATSPAIARHLRSLGLEQERCTTMFEPIIPPPDDCVHAPNGNEVPVVSIFSMITPWKGQDVFLEAIALARQQFNGPFRAIVAGTSPAGETEFRERLKKMTMDLHIADIVEFVGHQRSVFRFVSTIDIAVHASVEPEPFGRVVAEAMSCAVPVIATEGGGPTEYVEDGVSGFHVPRRDPQKMAEATVKLLESPQRRADMGNAGRRFVLRELHPQHLAQRTFELYQQLLKSR